MPHINACSLELVSLVSKLTVATSGVNNHFTKIFSVKLFSLLFFIPIIFFLLLGTFSETIIIIRSFKFVLKCVIVTIQSKLQPKQQHPLAA